MRIIIIHPVLSGAGGIFKASLGHAISLKARGHEVTILTASPKMIDAAKEKGIDCLYDHSFKKRVQVMFKGSIRKKLFDLKKGKIDAVIHQAAKSWIWGRLIFPTAPHYIVFHNPKIGSRNLYLNWLVLTGSQRDLLQKQAAKWPPRKISIIKNTSLSDLDNFPAPREDLLTKKRLVIGSLAEIRHKKGYDILVRAAKILSDKGHDFELVLGGSGERSELETLCQDLNIADKVKFPGWITDPDGFYKDIDIYCLPSRDEPFGLVVIEAMKAGLPMIATKTYGPKDIITDGKTGWLVDIEDVQGLADCLEQRLTNREDLLQVTKDGQKHAIENYSFEAVGRSLEDAILGKK